MSRCLEALYHAAGSLLSNERFEESLKKQAVDFPEWSRADASPRIFYSTKDGQPNETIHTMKGGKWNSVEAMAIQDGRIIAVGSRADVKTKVPPGTTETDIGEKCILPGFVEPHLHIVLSALTRGFYVDCDPLRVEGQNFEGVVKKLQAGAAELKKGEWLMGYGYDPSRLELVEIDGKRQFRDFTVDVFEREGLNEIPALLLNASGHLAYANQKAFKATNIDENTPIAGGHLVVGKDGKLTGVCVEPPAFEKLTTYGFLANHGRMNLFEEGATIAIRDWSSKGFTTIFDAGLGGTGVPGEVISIGSWAKNWPFRVVGAAANLKPDGAVHVVTQSHMPQGGFQIGAINIKTIKLWMDGSTQGFTAALHDDYSHDLFPDYLDSFQGWARWKIPDDSQIKPKPELDIYDEMMKWALRGYQLMIHSNGDLSTTVVLDAFERLFKEHPQTKDLMHRMEHFTVANESQVQRAADLNIGVSHTIGHVSYWGNTFKNYVLGDERGSRIDPTRDGLKHQLCYSFNSDSPVSEANALMAVRTAATRLTSPQGTVVGEDQTVCVEAAIAGVTFNPARQVLLDDDIGSLEVGKSADFVILNKDIRSVEDAATIDKLTVAETWYKGDKRFPRPE